MSKDGTFRIKGWHVLAGFIAFFGLIIAVNAVFVIQATRSFPGESFERPYERGVRYNEKLQARRRADAEGWQASFTRDDDFVVSIVNAQGPVDGLEVDLVFKWAGQPDGDKKLRLTGIGDGQYQAGAPFTLKGGRFEGAARRPGDLWVFEFGGQL